MVPLSAHALFARPLVVGPDSSLAVELLERSVGAGVLWCDGRRTFDLPSGARVVVRRSPIPVRLARLNPRPFTDRLVNKFRLPVTGWRGPGDEASARDRRDLDPRPRRHRRSTAAARARDSRRSPARPARARRWSSPRSGCCSASVPTAARSAPAQRRPSSRGTGRSPTAARSPTASATPGATSTARPADSRALVLGRSVTADGRSRAVVGGRAAPVGVLSEIGQHLVVVHGQSDQIRLRSATAQREALDRYAGPEFAVLLGDYQEVFRRWQTEQGELDVLVAERDRRAREADELRAGDGRDRGRRSAARRRRRARRARRASDQPRRPAARRDRGAGGDLVAVARRRASTRSRCIEAARRAIDRVAGHDPALAPIAESLAAASFAVTEVSGQLSSYLGSLDADAGRELETLQERRAQLAGADAPVRPDARRRRRLPRVRQLPAARTRQRRRPHRDARRRGRRRPRASSTNSPTQLTARRTRRRRNGSRPRSPPSCSALAMPDARLTIEVDARPTHAHRPRPGRDPAAAARRHRAAPARARAPRAASSRASCSRSRSCWPATDPVPTFVFDEVDAGVGGASATEIGDGWPSSRSARRSSWSRTSPRSPRSRTTTCVVEKGSDGSVTTSSVRLVHADERAQEMARLLSGSPDSESALAHARELLEAAHGRWNYERAHAAAVRRRVPARARPRAID